MPGPDPGSGPDLALTLRSFQELRRPQEPSGAPRSPQEPPGGGAGSGNPIVNFH